MKFHQSETMQDYAGNPLGHLSYCFTKCVKDVRQANLSQEEETCTDHCITKSLEANLLSNQGAGQLFNSYRQTMMVLQGRTIEEVSGYKPFVVELEDMRNK